MGSPFEEGVLCGPLLNKHAMEIYKDAINAAVQNGGQLRFGGEVISDLPGNYVLPTIISVTQDNPASTTESFVPIVYVLKAASLQEAIHINNAVGQGLSSSLFTESMENVFTWTGLVSHRHSPS